MCTKLFLEAESDIASYVGEELKCQREVGNSHDPLAVACSY